MRVNFNGNYVLRFKDKQVRNIAYDHYQKNNKNNEQFIEKAEDKNGYAILVVDGPEKESLLRLSSLDTKFPKFNNYCLLQAYLKNAMIIDCKNFCIENKN